MKGVNKHEEEEEIEVQISKEGKKKHSVDVQPGQKTKPTIVVSSAKVEKADSVTTAPAK